MNVLNALATMSEPEFWEKVQQVVELAVTKQDEQAPAPAPFTRLLDLKDIKNRTGFGRYKVKSMINAGMFPPPVCGGGYRGGKRQLWRAGDVEQFIQEYKE